MTQRGKILLPLRLLVGVGKMKILVQSNDGKLLPLLEDFARLSNEEYSKMRKGIKMRIIGVTGMVPLTMGMEIERCEGGAYVKIPFSVPELTALRNLIRKTTGREVTGHEWKNKMIKQLGGYLSSEGIKYEGIVFVEV